ncbi:MAG: hypothetical protein JXQ73_08875, partial [Phycisphaerae bacterium]|nr:hypothetical protein [Phycisphaerae bacterium]
QAPRGELRLLTGAMVKSRAGNPYFFTGRRLDVLDIDDNGTPNHFTDDRAGLQIYYYRARTMHPVMGRFLQRDPLTHTDGANLYEYTRSAPHLRADPSGLMSISCCNTALQNLGGDPQIAGPLYDAWTKKDAFGRSCLNAVSCKNCNDPNQGGHYDPISRNITLCADSLGASPPLGNIKVIIHHELIHAVRTCGSLEHVGSCSACMREEIQAYYCSGGCTGLDRYECVKRAWASCQHNLFSPCRGKNLADHMPPRHRWPPRC